ncbi:MAG: MBL fold metallo-hydrolase [Ruminococcaceae bacterium]|nr:MBL fold metallo-hydrolase [Oscillospiraceae bacterium]
MKLFPIVYARSTLPESMIFENGRKDRTRPIAFILYYVESENRRILIDAGCDSMPGFEMQDFIGPLAALEGHGISKHGITDVILTHAHHDHAQGAMHFPHARIYVHRDAYPRAKRYISPAGELHLFDSAVKITEEVEVLHVGGHARGSSVVRLCDGNDSYVVVGDECYLRDCVLENIPTGVSCDPAKSRAFLEACQGSKDTILFCHDERPLTKEERESV